ncbi:membrane or secreted protein [Candidatus Magnetobacterium bavaricum]|uniref:Membrane or secreted protein n=1 Tax=Candidatus Magnetobacterium bavaricum TaxID=29290 RepID=A0A0F3GST1_9BACT|nr:membrane or secreted protein [Candidatus Magnetobacterium bavaricum]
MMLKKARRIATMLSTSVTRLTVLSIVVVFVCVSCVSESVRKEGGGQKRFYDGQQARIVDILRESNEARLNNNFDRALALANEAMEKSTTTKDDIMRLSCGFWIMTLLSETDKQGGPTDAVPNELLVSAGFESLFYGYLLVMYDINAFDLRGKDPSGVLFGSMPGNNMIKSGSIVIAELKKTGEVNFADLIDSLIKSYTALLKAYKDKDADKTAEYTRKVIGFCDDIALLTDDPKLSERDKNGLFFMSRMFAMFIKLPVAAVDRDSAAYEKVAGKYAKFVAGVMPK